MRKGLRYQIGEMILKNRMKDLKRNGQIVSFENSKKIGILYDSTNEEDYELIKGYVKQIRDQHKDVQALGYVDSKQLPNNRFIKLGLDFVTRKMLDWKYEPKDITVKNFIEEPFDILILLNVEKCLPLQYIAVESKAKFRISNYADKNTKYSDMMIRLHEYRDLGLLVEQVNHYLKKIRND
ncbi:MAG: hypothetical protein HKN22_06790 [Bacteroidia bacterium]|nr:hypothetical protein [Bacteroidia bacterium]